MNMVAGLALGDEGPRVPVGQHHSCGWPKKYGEVRLDSELTEVRWVSLAEAAELMGDMAGVVGQHLAQSAGRLELPTRT